MAWGSQNLKTVVFCAASFLSLSPVYGINRANVLLEALRRKANPAHFYPHLADDAKALNRMRGRLERVETRIRARPERMWWRDRASLLDQAALERAIGEGRITSMRDMPGLGMSANNKMPYTTPVLELAQQDVLNSFKGVLAERALDSSKTKLVITSIMRTEEYQRGLIAQGFPAAMRSSHTKGIAFDISTQWFDANAPQYSRALHAALFRDFRNAGNANVIREELQSVWHIALSPSYYEDLSKRLGYPGWIE